jgi:hypothetical protein
VKLTEADDGVDGSGRFTVEIHPWIVGSHRPWRGSQKRVWGGRSPAEEDATNRRAGRNG